MASQSERTYGARIANAQKLLTLLNSFDKYTPPVEALSANALQDLITSVEKSNEQKSQSYHAYTLVVDNRFRHYFTDDLAMHKVLSPLLANLRAVYGKESREYTSIAALAEKIRGGRKTKKEKPEDEASVSQSQRSYGSMKEYFRNIITTLSSHSKDYESANSEINISALQAIIDKADALDEQATTTYSQLKQHTDTREQQYLQLSELCQRIKEAVKAQYGVRSGEYKQVRTLLI